MLIISNIVVLFAPHGGTLHIDNVLSVYKLKRVGDATHPCLTPCCLRISSDKSFMILTEAVCYWFLMICTSFPSTPISRRHCMTGSCLIHSNAFL